MKQTTKSVILLIIHMSNTSQQKETLQGVIIQSLPNAMFMVRHQTSDGEAKEILTYVSGKMTFNRIRILIGDRVTVEIDPYGGKGKIIRRG